MTSEMTAIEEQLFPKLIPITFDRFVTERGTPGGEPFEMGMAQKELKKLAEFELQTCVDTLTRLSTVCMYLEHSTHD